MSAHNEGLTWFARRTGQFRYSVNGHDQWLQPLSIYTAGEDVKRGQPVSIVVHADTENILSVDLPPFVVMEVTYSEPGLKGDTATNTLKPAKIETIRQGINW